MATAADITVDSWRIIVPWRIEDPRAENHKSPLMLR
jgi:hypothetical protein